MLKPRRFVICVLPCRANQSAMNNPESKLFYLKLKKSTL